MFEIEAEKRTKNCQEAYNKGFKEGYECGYNKNDLNMGIKRKCLCCGCEFSVSPWIIQDFCDRCFSVVLREVFDKNNDNLTVEKLRNKIKEKLN